MLEALGAVALVPIAYLLWVRRRALRERPSSIGGSFRIRRRGFVDIDSIEGVPMLKLKT